VSADVDITAVNALLSSVPERQVAPIFTISPVPLRRETARLEERTGAIWRTSPCTFT
jgi:hypothetical protein